MFNQPIWTNWVYPIKNGILFPREPCWKHAHSPHPANVGFHQWSRGKHPMLLPIKLLFNLIQCGYSKCVNVTKLFFSFICFNGSKPFSFVKKFKFLRKLMFLNLTVFGHILVYYKWNSNLQLLKHHTRMVYN